ncbi:hypothetical protein Cni_G13108 [Canna indica]|uniref:Endonuclease/exonuclease/phosphatase n=1 Tax=Canna indica TaxID=4628 RepID=A0AAQ3K902_9LILI|nr:hypothetical protein Cni_G13108 [Canna indica]
MGGLPFRLSLLVLAFREFVHDLGLVDLGFSGSPFTWCNNRQGNRRIQIRLDRVFCNAAWLHFFDDASVKHLNRGVSNHCPLLFSFSNDVRRNRLFRFQIFWVEYPESSEVVSQAWHEVPCNLTPHSRFGTGLRLTRFALSSWNVNCLGVLEKSLEDTVCKISSLEISDAMSALCVTDECELRMLYNKAVALRRQISLKWWAKSKQ